MLAGQLSREEAILARQDAQERRYLQALELKEESRQLQLEVEDQYYADIEAKRALVEATTEARSHVHEAKDKITKVKQEQTQLQKDEYQELKARAELEQQREQAKRAELIRYIVSAPGRGPC